MFRFVLELTALIALAVGGYALADGALGWVLAVVLPTAASAAWVTFNVPGDASRNGEAPVPVPGLVRLMVELDVFTLGVIIGWFASPALSIVLAAGVFVHYLASVDRIRWLLGTADRRNRPAR